MSKVTAIIGQPAVGKSRLIQELMRQTPIWIADKVTIVGKVRMKIPYHIHTASQTTILGDYFTESQYPGTDRLSMAVQSYALAAINKAPAAVIFEGDRLGNLSFFESLLQDGHELHVIRVVAQSRVLAERRASERQEQDDKFVRSRKTKIENLQSACIKLALAGMNIHYSLMESSFEFSLAENVERLKGQM